MIRRNMLPNMNKCENGWFRGNGIKIDRVNSIRVAKPLTFFYIFPVVVDVIMSYRFLLVELAPTSPWRFRLKSVKVKTMR